MLECFIPREFTKVESLHFTQLVGFILEVDHSLDEIFTGCMALKIFGPQNIA